MFLGGGGQQFAGLLCGFFLPTRPFVKGPGGGLGPGVQCCFGLARRGAHPFCGFLSRCAGAVKNFGSVAQRFFLCRTVGAGVAQKLRFQIARELLELWREPLRYLQLQGLGRRAVRRQRPLFRLLLERLDQSRHFR